MRNFLKRVYYKMKYKVSGYKSRKDDEMERKRHLRDSAQLERRKFVKCYRLKFLEAHDMLYTTDVYNAKNKRRGP